MTERPILFSGAMVRAILSGNKTQTRRPIKPQPPKGTKYVVAEEDGLRALCVSEYEGGEFKSGDDPWRTCPYGRPGDRLWVRHKHWRGCKGTGNDQIWDEYTRCTRWETGKVIEDHDLKLDADGKHTFMQRKPSIHMPRWASIIQLEVKGVRVERLKAIAEDDAKAEGVPPIIAMPGDRADYCGGFYFLWNEINADRGYSWESNPWVWVIGFERLNNA